MKSLEEKHLNMLILRIVTMLNKNSLLEAWVVVQVVVIVVAAVIQVIVNKLSFVSSFILWAKTSHICSQTSKHASIHVTGYLYGCSKIWILDSLKQNANWMQNDRKASWFTSQSLHVQRAFCFCESPCWNTWMAFAKRVALVRTVT